MHNDIRDTSNKKGELRKKKEILITLRAVFLFKTPLILIIIFTLFYVTPLYSSLVHIYVRDMSTALCKFGQTIRIKCIPQKKLRYYFFLLFTFRSITVQNTEKIVGLKS